MSQVQPTHCRPLAFEAMRAAVVDLESTEGLLRAAVALSLHGFPESETTAVEIAIAALGDLIAERVVSGDPRAVLAHAHALLFDELGFGGDLEAEFRVENSCLPQVIESRCGLPIVLAMVYKLVMEYLGLRVFGVGSQHLFLACVHLDTDATMLVDAAVGGRVVSVAEAVQRVRRMTGGRVPPNPLPVVTHRDWIAGILAAAVQGLSAQNRFEDCAAMRELAALL